MTPWIIFAVAIGFAGLIALSVTRDKRRAARELYIDEYAFPPGVRERVRKHYPHLNESQLDLVFAALRDYFHLCRKANRRLLAMPSQVVDVAWHEFILFTRNYQSFCGKALGRFLHHTPAEAMPARTSASDSIKRTWRLACLHARLDPKKPVAVPLLFVIDQQLAIADGFHYLLNCTHMVSSANAHTYCASHIGCGGGCGGGCSGSSCGGDGGGDGGGGCGGGGGD